jgi:signal transduction histidine kinase
MNDKTRAASIAAELPAVHAATALFPLLAPDQLCALAADIAAYGLRSPIVRHHGAILDGRNRWIACKLAKVEPTYTEYANSGSQTAYVVSMNLKRRDLTAGQRAVVAVELEKVLAEEAKMRMRRGGEIAGRGRQGRERIPYPVGKAADQAGSLLRVSGRYVSAAKKLVAKAPEAADLVREGRISLPDAKQLIEVSAAQCRAAVTKIRDGEAMTVRAALPAPDVELAHLSVDETLPELLARIHTMLAVDTAVILFLDERAGSLRPHAAVGLDETRAREVTIPVGQGFAGRIADECRALMLEAVAPTDVLNPVLLETGVRSLFGVPIRNHGRVLGVLHVGTREPRRFTDADSRLLQLVADCLGLVIGRGPLYAAEIEARAATEASLSARAEAERLKNDRLKEDLTDMVVHDLKNPVTSIAMLVQLALRKGQQLPTTQRDLLLQIERTCGEMMRLIQNLLEISELEEGKMPVTRGPIVLAEIVDEVVVEYGPVAEQTGRRLVAAVGPELPCVVADRALLKRVLVNLLMNALRHSGSAEVRVEATHDPATAGVSLRVIDHGRGIPEDDQERVFEKFASIRRSGDSEPSSDTGLGLPFCKLATECMGGKIALSSRPEAGTVFTVILPSL